MKIDKKLSALQLIADEIRLEMQNYRGKKTDLWAFVERLRGDQPKAAKVGEMKLKIDYWQ